MKNRLFEFILCIFLIGTYFLVIPDIVSADDLIDGDYKYIVIGEVATITGYIGPGGVITIPSTLGGYPTVHIGDNAFNDNQLLESVTIPTNVTSIGNSAFDSCSNLTSVTIPDSVTTIGSYAFISCSSLASITIPMSVISIGSGAFSSCSSLSSVTIPSSVISIGKNSFTYCSNLTAINVDLENEYYASINGVLYNKDKTVLIQCPGGKSGMFNIPYSVTTIGSYAFISCSSLTSVTIPNSVTIIEYNAFASCSSLTSITIGNGVTTIGKAAFLSCSSLTSIIIPDSVISIGDFAFSYCPLTSMAIGSSVTTIGFFAFSYCPLTSVIIGDSVTAIGNYAFYSCTSLTSITFLGLLAPDYTGSNWILNTPSEIRGHAYSTSNFPPPGITWNGLTMGAYISVNDSPELGSPSPMNGSTANPISLSWTITIEDPEGDNFDWTIQCSNGQSANANDASNGTKSLTLSGLSYLTTYTIWVNATDPSGSGMYTRKWYTITTHSENQPPIPPEPSNINPVANVSAGEPYQGIVNSTIFFDGSNSYDPDGTIVEWFWDFGDYTNATGIKVNHIYLKEGTYLVTLTVFDDQGATHTGITHCMISRENNKPPTKPTISGPRNGTKNIMYTYSVVSTDTDNDTIQYIFDWGDSQSISHRSGFLPNNTSFITNHSWSAAGRYEVTVTATDNQTESALKIMIYIDAVQVGEIGYLLDNDSNGTYDTFYSDVIKGITAVQKKNGIYNIDSDGNGVWDYTFNVTNGLISFYQEEEKTPGFEIVFFISAIAMVIILKRKRNLQ